MKKLPISAFIICCNEKDRIYHTINSLVDLVCEIIVVDSGSTDGTIEYLKSVGITPVFKKWEGYVSQKIYAENLCSNDWVLNLDADEALSEKLIEEIRHIFNTDTLKPNGYKIKKVFVDPLKNKLNSFNPYLHFILLYHKSVASYQACHGSLYKDSVKMLDANNKPQQLKNPIWHRSKVSLHQMLAKMNDYTELQATEMVQKNRHFSAIRSLIEIPFTIFKYFILRRYFMLGRAGFHDSVCWAFGRFIKQAKTWEKHQKQKNGDQ
ncbi:MAG: glycosyltransferase [Alphaproteobacteria bacterium CG_4_10_14_0_8_um_filter_37_21]|nr:MAG: glycosyltransferase [Alphaproteobacteria bacterium CG_4_10_14_0_8_um_filter_37_21]